MWLSRMFGLLLAAGGAGLLGFLWSQVLDLPGRTNFTYRIGVPGALLLAALGIILFFFGMHLFIAPRSAVRRWTPRPRRRTQGG